MTTDVKCPCCHGRKYLVVIEHYYDGSVLTRMKCCHCDGQGEIEVEVEKVSEIQPKTSVNS